MWRAFAVVAFVACWTGQQPDPVAPPANVKPPIVHPQLSLTMERTGCLGFCPSYTVKIHSTGALEWLGEANVMAIGERRGRVSASSLGRISRALDVARFFERDEAGKLARPPACVRNGNTVSCSLPMMTMCSDTPHTILSVRRGDELHVVDDAHCNNTDTTLEALEQLIDQVGNTQAWIGR